MLSYDQYASPRRHLWRLIAYGCWGLVAWLGARFRLRDVTFQEPEIEDVIRRIYEEGLLLGENEMAGQCVQAHEQEIP